MDPEQLADLILESPDLATARRVIEEHLPLRQADPLLYAAIHQRARDDLKLVWRTMLVSARMAPEALALSMHVYGRLLAKQGDANAGREVLDIAGAAYEWAGDKLGAARIKANLADLLYRQDEFNAALVRAREAEQLFQSSIAPPEEQSLSIARCRLTMMCVYAELQDREQSLAFWRSAIDLLTSTTENLDQIDHQLSIADAEINGGALHEDVLDRFDEAEQAYARAAQILDGLRERVSPERIRLVQLRLAMNQAVLALRLGRHGDARFALDTALGLVTEENLEDNVDLHLYRLYQALLLGDRDEANRLVHQIHTLTEQLSEDELAKQSADLLFYEALLQPPARAFTLLGAAVERYAQMGVTLMPAIVGSHQAEQAYLAGRPDEARRLIELARPIFAQGSPRRLRELERLQAIYEPETPLEELRRIAGQLRADGDYAGSVAVLSTLGERLEQHQAADAALAAYLEAMTTLEQAQGLLRLSLHSLAFLNRRRQPFERAFRLAAERDATLAFTIAERAHAQLVRDELVNEGLQRLLERTDLNELQQARTRLERIRARTIPRSLNLHRNDSNATAHDLMHERAEAEQAYLAMLATLQARGIHEAGWVQSEPPDVAAIQDMLPEGTLLLTYMVIPTGSDSSELWATGVTTRQVHCRRVANPAELKLFLEKWRQLPPVSEGRLLPLTEARQVLTQLYRYFIKPVESWLAGIKRLICVPDETLPLLPLHAALHPSQGYLLEHYTVSYAPSAAVLLTCRRRAPGRIPGTGVVLAGWEGDDHLVKRLPYVKSELESLADQLKVAALYGPLRNSELLPQLSGARLIHLACHGIFPPGAHGRFAHLVLGGDQLYAHDFYGLNLRADLLTMNACDTGLHGPGLQGLVSAALVAGASAVLASMWAVDDQVAPELMKHFYEALISGRYAADEALRRAQLVMLEAKAHPSTWGPYFLTGFPVDSA